MNTGQTCTGYSEPTMGVYTHTWKNQYLLQQLIIKLPIYCPIANSFSTYQDIPLSEYSMPNNTLQMQNRQFSACMGFIDNRNCIFIDEKFTAKATNKYAIFPPGYPLKEYFHKDCAVGSEKVDYTYFQTLISSNINLSVGCQLKLLQWQSRLLLHQERKQVRLNDIPLQYEKLQNQIDIIGILISNA
uniref:Uncharacterized protein n=1 Tax=Spironucleus salmonicida TaxID=348837 RepID=V6LDU3_9EUKA|eukprot:EST42443.1 Hypothetical protein SS50377_18007 [Spironucleus salmonicida]